jgi:hypothetical protein
MKKILKYSILMMVALGMISLQGCEEERWGNSPNLSEHIGAVTLINMNPDKTFYNALNDLATEEVEFEINVDGFEVTVVNSVDVEMIFTEKNATKDAEGKPADLTYDPVLVKTVNSFPSTVTFSATEAIEAIKTFKPNFTIDSLEVGDGFNLVFPIHTADGRRLTTALNSDLCNEQIQPSFGGCNVAWAISCPSNIPVAGVTYSLSTNVATTCCGLPLGSQGAGKTATVTDQGDGKYLVSDIMSGHIAPFGLDPEPVLITDVCGNLSLSYGTGAGLDYSTGPHDAPMYNEATGVWTISFNNAGNGISGIATLTPQ